MTVLHKCHFCLPGKIKDVLAEGVVDSLTKLVLVNAIYFKGSWNKKFLENSTQTAKFRLNKVTLHKGDLQWKVSSSHCLGNVLHGNVIKIMRRNATVVEISKHVTSCTTLPACTLV